MKITAQDIEQDGRFSRFELISWWDQKRLSSAKILIIGAGALGNEIIKNCAMLGIGNILVADMDRIENSNLSRSVLFRANDNGQYKSDIACRSARDIYPDIRAKPFVGNVVHDLGLGVFFWADIIIGGLDNREARVSINSNSFFAGKPWIDGAIETLSGVARVFSPGDGPCYECTMNETDWKMLESRRSCALLTRTEMLQGRVPTTPTTASVIAGFQTQEMVKIIHHIPSIAGKGFVYDGMTGESYVVSYSRNPDCYAHDRFSRLVNTGFSAKTVQVGQLLQRAKADLGEDAVVGLSRDVITALNCSVCNTREPVHRSLGAVTEAEGRCPQCGQLRAPETLFTLGLDDDLNDLTLQEIGVPNYDVLTARNGDDSISYLLDGDADFALGDLAR